VRKTLPFLFVSLLAVLPNALCAQTIRVNCGGGSYKDSQGQAWLADTGFSGGTAESIAATVAGTADPLLFEDYRWNPTGYSFKVANGQYHVNLYFVESNPQAEVIGGRVFDVSLQGSKTFANLDIFSEVGANAALVKTANVTVTNGAVTIGFAHVAGLSPKISAIEIDPGAAQPMLTLNFKYPDGTPVNGTLNYAVSSSLLNFSGAAALSNGQAQCLLFANPSALGISAQFNVNLNLTDSAGHQLWQLNVGMNPSGVNLGAVQSSTLNVVVQKQ
jgi:malectin (di-glucose binding ER protein)